MRVKGHLQSFGTEERKKIGVLEKIHDSTLLPSNIFFTRPILKKYLHM
jgi:hypothetical protein